MIPNDPEENRSEEERAAEQTEDAAQIKQALAEETTRAEKYLANWQRAQADFENYKRRTEQEKEDLIKYANSALILKLLSTIDDLERAFGTIPEDGVDAGWLEGIKLIERKLMSGLESQGLSRIQAVGQMFDPNLHEAVRQDNGKDGAVIGELQSGYKLHDRVLRPSQVVVGNGETE